VEVAVVEVAVKYAQQESLEFMVEDYVFGEDYRVLVVDYKVVAVTKRIPANVVGDGEHMIQELVDKKNENRSEGYQTHLSKIKMDEETEQTLSEQGFTLNSVPEEGKMVFLRKNANLSSGGESINLDSELHPENVVACEGVARKLGLKVAGIDILTGDLQRPFGENGGIILEVNARPRIRMHQFPVQGKPVMVADKIIDMLFPDAK